MADGETRLTTQPGNPDTQHRGGIKPQDRQSLCVKWKNIDIGPAYYYITGTVTEWLPLLRRPGIRELVCADIRHALDECGGSLAAYVIMPNHLHLLVHLPEVGMLHKFCKLWRGRSGRHIPQLLEKHGDEDSLAVLARHANGGCKHATWKEQARALPMWSRKDILEKVGYIHGNPVRRGLVSEASDWRHSSCRFYERGEEVDLEITPIEA